MGPQPKVVVTRKLPEAVREFDNTFLLPHIGSATRDAMGFRALDNLDAIFAGRGPGDRVA